jgi:hypothetical protein
MGLLLDRLKAMVCVTVTKGVGYLRSWPWRYQEKYESLYDELGRIMDAVPVRWYSKEPEEIEREIVRAQRLGVGLQVSMSPPCPGSEVRCLGNLTGRIRRQWTWFVDQVAGRVPVVYVFCDVEGVWYSRKHPRTNEEYLKDELLHEYNTMLYDESKSYAPAAPFVRYGHLALTRYGRRAIRHYQYTDLRDRVDGGFNVPLYSMASPDQWMNDLHAAIEYAKTHGVEEGSVCVCPGLSEMAAAEGLDRLTPIADSNARQLPYDVLLDFCYGAILARPGHQAEEYGEKYKGGTYPATERVKSVFLWPGPFHPDAPVTAPPALVAFLEGLLTRKPPSCCDELRERQVADWNTATGG